MSRITLFSKIIVFFIGFHILFYFCGESVLYFKHLNNKFFIWRVFVIADNWDTSSVKVFDLIIATTVEYRYKGGEGGVVIELSIEKCIQKEFPLSNVYIWSSFCQRCRFAIEFFVNLNAQKFLKVTIFDERLSYFY